MIRRVVYLFFLMLAIVTYATAQKHYNFRISDFSYSSIDTKVAINFKIKNYKSYDRFDISVLATDSSLKTYNVNSLSDNFDLFGGRNYTIFWDPIKDGYTLDGMYKLDLNLTKATTLKIPYNKHKFLSLIFPGLGDYKIRNGWWHGLYGIIGYGAIYYAVDYNRKRNQNYSMYLNSYNVEESEDLFQTSKKQQTISRVLGVAAGLTWALDIGFLSRRINKVKRDMSKSHFYQSKQDRLYQKRSKKYKYLNTKEKYELYYDSAVVEFNKKQFGLARSGFILSKRFGIKDSAFLAKVNYYIDTATLEIDFKNYFDEGSKHLSIENITLAKNSFLKAEELKPNDSILKRIITSINEYQKYFSLAEKYFESKDFGLALTNFQYAIKRYSTDSVKTKIDITKKELRFIALCKQGDNLKSIKNYDSALEKYKLAIEIKPNNIELKNKITELEKIIEKRNRDENLYKKYIKDAEDFLTDYDFINALKNFNEALKIRPNDTKTINQIKKINDYNNHLANGDKSFKNKIFKSAIKHYKSAKELFPSPNVKRKIWDCEEELRWDILVEEGDAFLKNKDYKSALEKYETAQKINSPSSLNSKIAQVQDLICKQIIDEGKELLADKKYKEALEKYNLANNYCSTKDLGFEINKVKMLISSAKTGEKIENKKWYEIYNQNGLKVELLFEIKKGLCSNPYAVIYIEYRYTGRVSNTNNNKYISWSIEYERCDTTKWIFNHSVQVAGDLFKAPNASYPNRLGSNFSTPKKIKIMNESIKAGNDNIYFDVKSKKELSYKFIRDIKK